MSPGVVCGVAVLHLGAELRRIENVIDTGQLMVVGDQIAKRARHQHGLALRLAAQHSARLRRSAPSDSEGEAFSNAPTTRQHPGDRRP